MSTLSTAATPLEQQFLDENNVPQVLAPLFIGLFIDAVLLGLILSQFIYWSLRLRRDERWPLRILVYYITLASLGHSFFAQASGWSVFVGGYGDHLNILRGWWSKGECLFQLVIVMPVEAFYATRAYTLWGRPKVLKFSLPVLFTVSIAVGIASISTGPSDPISATTSQLFVAWAVTLLFIDWALSASIVVALFKKRSGLAHSDRLVYRVVFLSAEAQLVPSLATLGLVIKALVRTRSISMLALICVPKFWVICCLVVINHRRRLRRDVEKERQRVQNTLSYIPPEGGNPHLESGQAAPTGSQLDAFPDEKLGHLPALAYTDRPAIPTLSVEIVDDHKGGPKTATGTHSSDETDISMKSMLATPDVRGLSAGEVLGSTLGRSRSRGGGSSGGRSGVGDDDGVGEMSFEEMLSLGKS